MALLPSCSDYLSLIETPELMKVQELIGGHVEKTSGGKSKRFAGGFCIVFPYLIGSKKYAVRFWHANVGNLQERTRIIADYLKQIQLPYFVEFKYYHNGIATQHGVVPLVVMDWVSALPLKQYIKNHLHEKNVLEALSRKFFDMVADLHKHKVSHGDLQHGNILVKEDGNIVLVDYDSMYVPGLENFDDEIKGLKGYQHPSRWENIKATEKADYFSELVIYASIYALSIDPTLWDMTQMDQSEYMLFSEEDISNPGRSKIFSKFEDNSDLQGLSSIIKDYIGRSTIDDLQPLEDVVTKPKTPQEKLSELWGDNGHEAEKPEISDPTRITKKWAQSPSSKEDYSETTRNISEQW